MTAGKPARRRLALALLGGSTLSIVLGLVLPVVELERLGGGGGSYSVLGGIADLADGGHLLLGALVLVFSVLFPAAKLAFLARLLVGDSRRRERRRVLRRLEVLGKWSMLDVFVVATLIGAVQLGILSDARPRFGVYLFGAGILLAMLSTLAVGAALGEQAPRFSERELRRPARWARWLPLAGLALFLAGLALPLMRIEKWLFWEKELSLLGAILELARGGDPALAAALGFFVVLLPLARFGAVLWLRWRGAPPAQGAERVLRLDEWAMLEVYVLALLVVLVKITDVADVRPRAGLGLLLAAALLSAWDSWLLRRARRA